METVDYGDSEYRYELEGKPGDYGNESFGAHGYQTQEIDAESGEFVSMEETEDAYTDESDADDFGFDSLDME